MISIKLGFAPTRRSIFSAPAAIEYAGYTREKLAELADISVQFLADIEKGRKSMTVNTLRQIAAMLNVSTDYIVNGITPSVPQDEIAITLASLNDDARTHAEQLLVIFAEALYHAKSPQHNKP